MQYLTPSQLANHLRQQADQLENNDDIIEGNLEFHPDDTPAPPFMFEVKSVIRTEHGLHYLGATKQNPSIPVDDTPGDDPLAEAAIEAGCSR